MLSFASDVSRLLHAQDSLEVVAIKTASEGASHDAQVAVKDAADGIYRAITKVAEYRPDGQNPYRFCTTVAKMASALNRPQPTNEMHLKLAAAVVVDEAICSTLASQTTPEGQRKAAEKLAYGREYISELLRGVL